MNQDSVGTTKTLSASEKIAFASAIFSLTSVALGSLSMVLKLAEGDGKVEPIFFHQQNTKQENQSDNLYGGRRNNSSDYFNIQ